MGGNKYKYIRLFEELGSDDVSVVGGKNASLGEMIRALKKRGIRVPDGFATTAEAYREYIEHNDIGDKMADKLKSLKSDNSNLDKVGKSIRKMFRNGEFPDETAEEIRSAYADMSRRYNTEEVGVAVRSSATAEDLPHASFAGQQETFLNVSGEDDLLESCKGCYASLFTDRAISYREEKGFDHQKVALSVGVQKMVRADKAGSGVMFSIDTETGFENIVVIDASWGLGENVVQGAVNPDEYQVFKPLLKQGDYQPIIDKILGDKEKKMVYARGGETRNKDTSKKERRTYVLDDSEILKLAGWAAEIEDYYQKPMDIEWAKDGDSKDLFIVQARPETVQSQKEVSLMLGFRGASRYYSERYREGFGLECRAIKKVREEIGMDNVAIMIPFCRTVEEADKILEVLADFGLERGRHALKVYVMCEIPSNVILAEDFAQRFDGFSIGSNDLTQLVLGVDRDSAELSELFDERNPAVKKMIADLIEKAHKHGSEVGFCGQAPSDHPEFAEFLAKLGIDSISLNPDSVIETIEHIASVENSETKEDKQYSKA